MTDLFDPRRNAIGFLRLFAAGLVLVSHSFALGGFGPDPFQRLVRNQTTLGEIAVGVFFVLSGFLVTRSLLGDHRLRRFLWRRALRILPGFWVCLFITAFVFGGGFWWHHHGTLSGFLEAAHGPFEFVGRNALVRIQRWTVAGQPHNVPFPGINGSLWTLIDEVRCYLLLAAFAGLGFLRPNRRLILVGVTALCLLLSVHQFPLHTGVWFPVDDTAAAAHYLAFMLGVLAYQYRDRLPMTAHGALAAALVVAATFATQTYSALGVFPVAYLVLYASVRLPFRRINTSTDRSYGLYIYAFPIQQSLATLGVQRAGPIAFITLTAIATTVLATASWHFVEKPCLRLR